MGVGGDRAASKGLQAALPGSRVPAGGALSTVPCSRAPPPGAPSTLLPPPNRPGAQQMPEVTGGPFLCRRFQFHPVVLSHPFTWCDPLSYSPSHVLPGACQVPPGPPNT